MMKESRRRKTRVAMDSPDWRKEIKGWLEPGLRKSDWVRRISL